MPPPGFLGCAGHFAAPAVDQRTSRMPGNSVRPRNPMSTEPAVGTPVENAGTRRLMVLLAMAMFVLVVDTSLMNVSISAVIGDLDTTASAVQSTIALEALVSAAFILINSKI